MKPTRSLVAAAVLAIALSANAQPSTQPAQSYPALQRRLAELTELVAKLSTERAALEKENAALRDRVRKLEAAATEAAAAAAPLTTIKNGVDLERAVREKIEQGQQYREVRAILGEPTGLAGPGAGGIYARKWSLPAPTDEHPDRVYQASISFADLTDGARVLRITGGFHY